MKADAHGAIVAGLSSAAVAGWIRSRVVDEYDPTATPVPLRRRLRRRRPLALAGLGFTGLSTAVAYSFDAVESRLLGDAADPRPLRQQLEHHRELHSALYAGGVVGAAHLVRHAAGRLGEWIATRLGVSELAAEIAASLDSLATWVINAVGTGYAGHLLGDVPTSGRGGTALRLLKPFWNRNCCLGWVTAETEPLNQYLVYAGVALSGAAWSVSGAYLASWKPPERRLGEYVERLRDCDGFEQAAETIVADVSGLFDRLLEQRPAAFWERSLFESPYPDLHPALEEHWFHQRFDPDLFGLERFDPALFVERDVWPDELGHSAGTVPLYGPTDGDGGVPLAEGSTDDRGVPLRGDSTDETATTRLASDPSTAAERSTPIDDDDAGDPSLRE